VKGQPVDLTTLNAAATGLGMEPFTPTPDGEAPTILDVIADAHARTGSDPKQIQRLVALVLGMPSQESTIDKVLGAVGNRVGETAEKAGSKVGNILGVAGGALSFAPAGRALANAFPQGSWKWWQAIANEYATNPMMGPNHPQTIKAQQKAAELRARAGE